MLGRKKSGQSISGHQRISKQDPPICVADSDQTIRFLFPGSRYSDTHSLVFWYPDTRFRTCKIKDEELIRTEISDL